MKKITLSIVFVLTLAMATTVWAEASTHTVVRGDTLYKISKSYHMELEHLIRVNPQIKNPDLIFPGETIYIEKPHKKQENTFEDMLEWYMDPLWPYLQNTSPTPATFQKQISSVEKDLMARIVHAEARGESFEGKVAVAHVILNRVEHDQFPDTITEVIYQPRQFQPVSNGAYRRQAGDDSIRAVEVALRNRSNNEGALYFYNPDIATSKWIFSRETVKTIGNHVFAR